MACKQCTRLALELACATVEAVAISEEINTRTEMHTDIPATIRSWARESEAARVAALEAILAHRQSRHHSATHKERTTRQLAHYQGMISPKYDWEVDAPAVAR